MTVKLFINKFIIIIHFLADSGSRELKLSIRSARIFIYNKTS